MITVLKNSIDLSGEWFDFSVGDIRLKIRPLIWDISSLIEDSHKTLKSSKFHNTKIIKRTTTNFETFGKDLLDYMLEDFQGIFSAPDKPLENTLQNKMAVVLSIKGVHDFIWAKARELATRRIKEAIKFEVLEEKI